MPRPDVTLENPSRALGLLAAFVVAWALLVPLPLLVDTQKASMIWPQFGEVFGAVILMAVFGLPLSFAYCVALGYPAWLIASSLGFKRRRNAGAVGAILGMVLDLAILAVSRAPLFAVRPDEPVARLAFFSGLALYIVGVGAAAGLAAWWAAGAKSVNRDEAISQLFA